MFLRERFTKKTNKKDLTIEKEIKRNVNKLYTKWKGYDNCFNRWIDKCDIAIQKIIFQNHLQKKLIN